MATPTAPHNPTAAVIGQKPAAAATLPLRRLSVARAGMHPSVYKLALLCWALFMGVFWVTFFVSSNALFMVVIGTFYALMFFGIPFVFTRIRPKDDLNFPSLAEFARGRFETFQGTIGAGEAILQVVLVPLCLGIGGIVIGFIIRAARAAPY